MVYGLGRFQNSLAVSVAAAASSCTRKKNSSVLGNLPGCRKLPMAGAKLVRENFFSEKATAASFEEQAWNTATASAMSACCSAEPGNGGGARMSAESGLPGAR